jgi:hypothetical protein
MFAGRKVKVNPGTGLPYFRDKLSVDDIYKGRDLFTRWELLSQGKIPLEDYLVLRQLGLEEVLALLTHSSFHQGQAQGCLKDPIWVLIETI